MLFYFLRISITLIIIIMTGCASQQVATFGHTHNYSTEIESQVKRSDSGTLRQAEVSIVISKSMQDVYEATVSALNHLDNTSIITPVSSIVSDREEATIIYIDREPIFYNKKPIGQTSNNSQKDDLIIFISLFMESEGQNATAVYYYPHSKLCNKIPSELQAVVDANLTYRGKQFIYRLETQLTSQEKWPYIDKGD